MRIAQFRFYLFGNLLVVLGTQMQTVAVGWDVYERTKSAMALAWVGFVQFVPVLTLTLAGGFAADRFPRKLVLMSSLVLLGLSSCGLAWTASAWPDNRPATAAASVSVSAAAAASVESPYDARLLTIYGFLLLSGIARAFLQPAKSAFLPQIVPRQVFSNAVTWNMSAFQLAAVAGPALGGFIIAAGGSATFVYLCDAVSILLFLGCMTQIASPPFVRAEGTASWSMLADGVVFVFRNPVILAAMTLDMFAVLLGGATTLLPVYAKDILMVGASGLGYLRAAPAVGALLTSFILTHRPPLAKAGRALLWAVAGFGLATIVFGYSRSFPLSLAMLFLTGAFDMVSVVVRHTLVQVLTPDSMRGRVSAVNSVFIGASNELGGFESGAVAAAFERKAMPDFGPTMSVVTGGFGTMLVVAIVALVCRPLRKYGRLDSAPENEAVREESTAAENPPP